MTAALPEGISHGGPTAYNRHRCRCEFCKAWRKGYDNARAKSRGIRQLKEDDAVREYIRSKGIRFYGPCPFRRSPRVLATMIADYLNDDLHLYIRDHMRRNA